jgi:ribosomal protein L11 methyltransferase
LKRNVPTAIDLSQADQADAAALESLGASGLLPRMTVKATFTAAFPEARRISEFLARDYGEAGAAISLDERGDGLWAVDAYFEEGSADQVAATLRDGLGADGFGAPLVVEVLLQTDWVTAGLASLAPIAAGRFMVHGSHDRGRVPAGRVAIEIDAGVAFGTGHHATTAGCLAALDRLMRARRFENPLDIGTGSGVLAIAMAKVLRRPVLATDIDPLATAVARKNAALNGVGNLVSCITAEGVAHAAIQRRAPYDLIVANILAEPLRRMAPQLAPLVAKRGTLVMSGLLPRQRERVAGAYRLHGIALRDARIFDGWSVLIFKRGRN